MAFNKLFKQLGLPTTLHATVVVEPYLPPVIGTESLTDTADRTLGNSSKDLLRSSDNR